MKKKDRTQPPAAQLHPWDRKEPDGRLSTRTFVPEPPPGMTAEEAAEPVKTSLVMPRGIWVMAHERARRERKTFAGFVSDAVEAALEVDAYIRNPLVQEDTKPKAQKKRAAK